MTTAGIIRRLSYHPWLIKAVRGVGLRDAARKVYYRWASPHQGVFRTERAGSSASFITRTPEQLRAVESGSMEGSLEILAHFLQGGDTFYDVGSHVGVYAILLAKVVGRGGVVVAFEPHRATYGQLLENVRLNGLENVRAFQLALGENAGEAPLYIGKVTANFSLLPAAIVGSVGANAPSEAVRVVRGDELADVQGLPIPRAVKIDVEGFEYAVLQGLRQTLRNPRCEMVCCEVHPKFLPADVKPADIIRLLASLGYTRVEGEPSDAPYHLIAYKLATATGESGTRPVPA